MQSVNWCERANQVNNAFSPEQMNLLGKALDQLVEKYGPMDETQKSVLAMRLLHLSEEGVWDIDELVKKAKPSA